MVKKRLVKDLHRHIRLEVDGRLVELPPVEGIIILNILRYTLFVDFKFLIKRSSYTGMEERFLLSQFLCRCPSL